jgi:hypothetical protein
MTRKEFISKARKKYPKLSLAELNRIWDDTIERLRSNPVISESGYLLRLLLKDE